LRSEWKSKSQDAGNTDSFAFRKSFVAEHIFSVPQTDTGAPVADHQGKRATVVQGTRQQKLGVTYGRCPTQKQLSAFSYQQTAIENFYLAVSCRL